MELKKIRGLSGWYFFALAAFQAIFLVSQVAAKQYASASTTAIFIVAILAFYLAVRQSNKAYNELIEAAANMRSKQQEAMDMLLRDCTKAQEVMASQRQNIAA